MNHPNPKAFPETHKTFMGAIVNLGGMSLRDYFAAHCPSDIARINDKPAVEMLVGKQPEFCDVRAAIVWTMAVEALLRYAYADAMLAERSKTHS